MKSTLRGSLYFASRSAAQANQHARPAKHDEVIARVNVALFDVAFLDIAQAPGEHDGLVVAA